MTQTERPLNQDDAGTPQDAVSQSRAGDGSETAIDGETFARLHDFVGDSDAILNHLIRSYIQNSTELVRRIVHAIRDARWDDAAMAAHALKSGSSMFGALSLAAMVISLEEMLENDYREDSVQLAGQIEEEHGRVIHRLATGYITPEPTGEPGLARR